MANYLVVGGTSGIGRALVDELINHGHHCWVWAREPRDLPTSSNVHFSTVDVTADELPKAALPETLAGIAYCPGSIELKSFRGLKADAFRAAFEINVIGAVNCIQAAERALKKSDQAAIVLFSTVAVQRGMPFHAAVAAAKGGIEGITRSLAAEFAPKIRVNAIAPSLTDTPLASKLLGTPEKRTASAERHPLKRIGTPTEIAKMAALLLSEDTAFVTGQIIGMDGGMGSI